MDNILQGLQALEGVNGAFVAEPNGHIVAYRAHAVYDATLLQEVSLLIGSSIDSVKLLHDHWDSVTAHFAEGTLLIRSLGWPKGTPMTLSVIADRRLNQSFASVAMRVAVQKLRAIVEGGGQAAPGLGASARGYGNASNPALASGPLGPVPVPVQTKSEVATSGMSWSGLGTSGLGKSGVAVADPASGEALTACTKALARSLGPMAKVFVKEAVIRICQDRPFQKAQAAALVAELEKQISDPGEAAQFRRSVLAALQF
jgi:predicted regulator of Ras-like GTPase activity (Roadblock/LC7/MglB family)